MSSLTTIQPKKLITLIQKELTSLETVLKKETLQTYWQIGKHIHQDLMHHQDRAHYGEQIFNRLADQFPIGPQTFRRMVQIYQSYPIWSTLTKLSWSHYLTLLTIDNEDERKAIEIRARKEGWSVKELKAYIKQWRDGQSKETIDILPLKRGRLQIFQYLEQTHVPDHPSIKWIDAGFHTLFPFPAAKLASFKTGDHLYIKKIRSRLSIKKTTVPSDELFTFKAYVKKIVDGDTLVVHVDFGLGPLIELRLRLRHINTPEKKTAQGKKATRFVHQRLDKCSFIIIKTYKTKKVDIYGRYLADIFYLKGELNPDVVAHQGQYLNQELLEADLAQFQQ